jgi:hypothetical protein
MKLLHVAETIKGGIATYLNDLVPLQLADDSFNTVQILIPRQNAAEVRLPAHSTILFERRSRAAGVVSLTSALVREILRDPPHIIHAHSTFAGAIVRVLRHFVPAVPAIVYCPHGWAFDRRAPALLRWSIRQVEIALAARAERIIAISSHELERALNMRIPPARIALVRNGRVPAARLTLWCRLTNSARASIAWCASPLASSAAPRHEGDASYGPGRP